MDISIIYILNILLISWIQSNYSFFAQLFYHNVHHTISSDQIQIPFDLGKKTVVPYKYSTPSSAYTKLSQRKKSGFSSQLLHTQGIIQSPFYLRWKTFTKKSLMKLYFTNIWGFISCRSPNILKNNLYVCYL